MKLDLPLSNDKKLSVLFRVEPGCLGPDGKNLIKKFCAFAATQTDFVDTDYTHMEIVPRFDKTLPEIEYAVANKKLSHDKAEKYLAIFKQDLDEFEMSLFEGITVVINKFFDR